MHETRFQSATRRLLLQVANRRRVYEAIVASPGIHVRAVARATGQGPSVATHHIDQLEKHGLVFSHRGPHRRTLYAAEHLAAADGASLHVLANPTCRSLARHILQEPERPVARLAEAAGLAPSTASHHLNRMARAGILERVSVGRTSAFLPAQPGRLRALLALLSGSDGQPAEASPLAQLMKRAAQHADDGPPGKPGGHTATGARPDEVRPIRDA